ncbi:hypothetical protein SAMN04488238_10385 [Roseicitreum antarcticum]|uniref:Secreted protein n=1 Tax=Roseicitreum antarcticum TaxID=564137 RepID=A0A1H2VIT2_9RHOB|nr:hypothetical protein SAMN04488238_10385 [Roseicitreum antarcticum]
MSCLLFVATALTRLSAVAAFSTMSPKPQIPMAPIHAAVRAKVVVGGHEVLREGSGGATTVRGASPLSPTKERPKERPKAGMTSCQMMFYCIPENGSLHQTLGSPT